MNLKKLRSPAQGHIPALDGIRGIAIFMVLVVHFLVMTGPLSGIENLIAKASGYGTLGIDLFFMLSGFLITGILMDTRKDEGYLKNFLVRRFLRIFPLYYLLLAIVFGSLWLLPIGDDPAYAKLWEAQPYAWTYLFNFFIAHEGAWTVPYIGHLWSLAVEEQFYIFWPFVVLWCEPKRLMIVSLALVILSSLCHLLMELKGYPSVTIHVFTFTRLNALCLGAVLANWLRRPHVYATPEGLKPVQKMMMMLLVGSVLLKIVIAAIDRFVPDMHAALEAFRTVSWLGVFAALHLAAVALPKDSIVIRFLQWRPLTFLGQYSYGLYIFHHFLSYPALEYHLIDKVAAKLGSQSVAALIVTSVGILISLLIAWTSFHVFEKHFLRLKDVLAPKKSPS